MSNVDGKTKAYFDRMLRLETEARDIAESKKDLGKEMKSAGFSKEDVAGIKLAVRRHFESADKKASRETAEEVAEALADFVSLPLGAAAVSRAAPKKHHDGSFTEGLSDAIGKMFPQDGLSVTMTTAHRPLA